MTEPARVPEEDQGRTDPRTVVPLRRRRTEDDHETAPEPLLRNVFGAVIRAARHDQKRTLAEVAERAGVSVPYLSEMERGRKDPSSEMLAAVCRALDLDLVDLVSRGYIELIGRRVEVEAPRRIGVRSSGRGDVLALAA